jgi:propanediol dehydratase large subunit
MAKDALLDVLVEEFHDRAMPKDIWQPSEFVDGQVVSIASLAAVKVLPEFGYQKVGHQWLKVLRPRQSMIQKTDNDKTTPQLDLDMP